MLETKPAPAVGAHVHNPPGPPTMNREDLLARFKSVRQTSVDLCRPLAAEDYRIQSMPDVSPPWWNLGHTTWFFAKNLLEPFTGDALMTESLEFVLNSYYESLGPRLPRHERGRVTRPTTDDVFAFRQRVDESVERLIAEADDQALPRIAFLVETGCQHEQQHQELLVTEIKHILGGNAAGYRAPYVIWPETQTAVAGTEEPSAADQDRLQMGKTSKDTWKSFEPGLYRFGNLEGGWCWDNEMPIHKAWLDGFAVLDRLITNEEYAAFVEDGGYRDPLLWLSNGWDAVQAGSWEAPLYWERGETGAWLHWTLAGARALAPDEPVAHVSFYEADAYIRWRSAHDTEWQGARLPTEREWEQAARTSGLELDRGTFLDDGVFHPRPAPPTNGRPTQLGGELWEWTTSHYEPYPNYQPFDGALMEYNGKFMDNQRVLRGGSCATPRDHIRASYRNFWPAATRFQFAGIRPAKPLD